MSAAPHARPHPSPSPASGRGDLPGHGARVTLEGEVCGHFPSQRLVLVRLYDGQKVWLEEGHYRPLLPLAGEGGAPAPDEGAPITEAEVEAAFAKLRLTAPPPRDPAP